MRIRRHFTSWLRGASWLVAIAVGVAMVLTGGPAFAQNGATTEAIRLDASLSIEKLIPQLAGKRVVFVGEEHDRYDHHLNQLEIIKGLHEADPNMAIGVEYFQQPFQQAVDDYIAGRTSEDDFLRRTEYFQRWGFDYRLYAPIFRYAREQHIPVRALNVPGALVSAVARVGIAGLAENQRAYLPKQIEPADEAYRNRLRAAFDEHPFGGADAFEHFVEAQLVWDEGMAESAAAYLDANPDRRMVILCGIGHVEYGDGIPKRLERRTQASYSVVINSSDELGPRIGDYLLLSERKDLPPASALGAKFENKSENGGDACRVVSLDAGGAAQKAGLRKGDVVLEIDARPIKTTADVRVALWQKAPGDHVQIKVQRRRHFGTAEMDFDVVLGAAKNDQ